MLRRSSLYRLAQQENLFDPRYSMDGFVPFLLGESGYSSLPWLMVPVQQRHQLSVLKELFNCNLRKDRCVVENTFGIWKQTFQELLLKSNFAVTFLPDVITCCEILHNVLMGQSHNEVEALFQVLEDEGMPNNIFEEELEAFDVTSIDNESVILQPWVEKRTSLGIYLGAACNIV